MKNVIVLLVLMSLSSCGGGGGGSSSKQSGISSLNFSSLLGFWSETDGEILCEQDGEVYVESYNSISEDEGQEVNDLLIFYSDSECTVPLFDVVVNYSAVISGNNMALTLGGEFMAPTSTTVRDNWNGSNLCGFNDWEVDTYKDISDTVCSEDPDETRLYTGISKSGSTLTFSLDGEAGTLYLLPE